MPNANQSPPEISDLQRELISEILEIIRGNRMAAGASLRESSIARKFNVSRSPVRAALDHLCDLGVTEHIAGRGYFLICDATDLPDIRLETTFQSVRRIYNAMINAHIDGSLAGAFHTSEIADRFLVENRPLNLAIQRLQTQELIEQTGDDRWVFSNSLKTRTEDDADMYRFRLLLEPSALLQPGFSISAEKIAALRAQQVDLMNRLETNFDVSEIYDANDALHGSLITACHNRFIINALNYYEPVGRMFEYRHYQETARTQTACLEHIDILDRIAAGKMQDAANLMHAHISAAFDAERKIRK